MKKVLLATTVLALSATVAAAEVKLSGDARMGVTYDGNASNNKLQFSSRVRATISMSSETDSGLAFGGSFGVHDAGQAATGQSGSVYISGAFGKLEMGDVVGAAEAVVGNLPEIGFTDIAANDVTYISGDGAVYSSAGNPGALYTYSTGGLTFALGMNDGRANAKAPSLGLTGDFCLTDLDPTLPADNCITLATPADRTMAYSVGVKYAVDGYSVSLGYEVTDPVAGASSKHLIVGGSAAFGDTTVNAFYGDGSGALSGFRQYGLGVTHKVDALTVKAMINRTEVGATKVTSYGVGAEYGLGGGATLAGGISDNNAPGTKAKADLGIKFSF